MIKAKFNSKIKLEIYNRDQFCIISWGEIETYHHAFYWAIYSNYWPNRNNADQWVGLTNAVHYEIHHWTAWKWQEYRKFCMDYLKNLWKKTV